MLVFRRDVLQAKQLHSELLQGHGAGNCFREFAALFLFLFADLTPVFITAARCVALHGER